MSRIDEIEKLKQGDPLTILQAMNSLIIQAKDNKLPSNPLILSSLDAGNIELSPTLKNLEFLRPSALVGLFGIQNAVQFKSFFRSPMGKILRQEYAQQIQEIQEVEAFKQFTQVERLKRQRKVKALLFITLLGFYHHIAHSANLANAELERTLHEKTQADFETHALDDETEYDTWKTQITSTIAGINSEINEHQKTVIEAEHEATALREHQLQAHDIFSEIIERYKNITVTDKTVLSEEISELQASITALSTIATKTDDGLALSQKEKELLPSTIQALTESTLLQPMLTLHLNLLNHRLSGLKALNSLVISGHEDKPQKAIKRENVLAPTPTRKLTADFEIQRFRQNHFSILHKASCQLEGCIQRRAATAALLIRAQAALASLVSMQANFSELKLSKKGLRPIDSTGETLATLLASSHLAVDTDMEDAPTPSPKPTLRPPKLIDRLNKLLKLIEEGKYERALEELHTIKKEPSLMSELKERPKLQRILDNTVEPKLALLKIGEVPYDASQQLISKLTPAMRQLNETVMPSPETAVKSDMPSASTTPNPFSTKPKPPGVV